MYTHLNLIIIAIIFSIKVEKQSFKQLVLETGLEWSFYNIDNRYIVSIRSLVGIWNFDSSQCDPFQTTKRGTGFTKMRNRPKRWHYFKNLKMIQVSN